MAITIERKEDETDDAALARAFTNPSVRSALTISSYSMKGCEVEIGELVKQLKTLCKDENFNAEEMLKAQAQTLDALFNNLAYNASLNFNNVNVFESLMKMALRAQNQSGKTLQVILQNQQNKLLNEAKANDSVDSSKTIEAVEGNKKVATLVAIDGGKVRRRKKENIAECV